MICYSPVIFSLASSHKANHLPKPQAGLCACIPPTQERWCSTASSPAAPRDALSMPPARAVHSVLGVGFSEQPRPGLQFEYSELSGSSCVSPSPGFDEADLGRFGSLLPGPGSAGLCPKGAVLCCAGVTRFCRALEGGHNSLFLSALNRNRTSRSPVLKCCISGLGSYLYVCGQSSLKCGKAEPGRGLCGAEAGSHTHWTSLGCECCDAIY